MGAQSEQFGKRLYADRETYLIDSITKPVGEWTNFKVLAGWGMDGRRIGWLGWNGIRLARNGELARLARRFPKQTEWLTEWLEAGCP